MEPVVLLSHTMGVVIAIAKDCYRRFLKNLHESIIKNGNDLSFSRIFNKMN